MSGPHQWQATPPLTARATCQASPLPILLEGGETLVKKMAHSHKLTPPPPPQQIVAKLLYCIFLKPKSSFFLLLGYSYSQSASAYSYDQQQQYPQATYGAGTTSTGTQHYQRQQSLPLCKASTCTNYVHYEQAVGVFDYCSPECRNSDLLQRERDRLKEDLRKLEEDLRTHARASAASHTGFGSTGYTSTFHTASTGKDRGAGKETTVHQ